MKHFDEMHEIIERIKEVNGGSLERTKNVSKAREIAKDILVNYGRLQKLSQFGNIQLTVFDPKTLTDVENVVDRALFYTEQFELHLALQTGSSEIQAREESNFVALTKSQVEEIETHIKSAREKIRDSEAFEEKHKRRLLGRLEKLQAEINKKVSDLDVMLAGVTEVTAVAGQSAKNLNPVVDLFKKMFQVADRSSEEPLALPSPPKQITDQTSVQEGED